MGEGKKLTDNLVLKNSQNSRIKYDTIGFKGFKMSLSASKINFLSVLKEGCD